MAQLNEWNINRRSLLKAGTLAVGAASLAGPRRGRSRGDVGPQGPRAGAGRVAEQAGGDGVPAARPDRPDGVRGGGRGRPDHARKLQAHGDGPGDGPELPRHGPGLQPGRHRAGVRQAPGRVVVAAGEGVPDHQDQRLHQDPRRDVRRRSSRACPSRSRRRSASGRSRSARSGGSRRPGYFLEYFPGERKSFDPTYLRVAMLEEFGARSRGARSSAR